MVLGWNTPAWPLQVFLSCILMSYWELFGSFRVTWHIRSDLLLLGDLVIYFSYFQAIKINCTVASR